MKFKEGCACGKTNEELWWGWSRGLRFRTKSYGWKGGGSGSEVKRDGGGEMRENDMWGRGRKWI